MLAPLLMGLIGGQRAMSPLAAVSLAASSGRLPTGGTVAGLLRHEAVAAAATALAVAELVGDKQNTAPDRIVPIGLAARFVTSSLAGAVLAGERRRVQGAAIGGVTAVLAAYPGWRLRVGAMRRFGQTATGLVEDALVVGGAVAVLRMAGSTDRV